MAFLDENGLAIYTRKIKDALSLTPVIVANVTTGSVATATYEDYRVVALSVNGKAELSLPSYGHWTVSATLNGKTTSSVVVNVEAAVRYPINLYYSDIWGVEWDKTSTTTWTRTDSAQFFVDPTPYTAGSLSYGSPFDDVYPWKEMEIVENVSVGTMVKIPKYWYKWTDTANSLKLQIANHPEDGFSVSPAHAARYSGDREKDYILVGRYHCNSNYMSAAGQAPITNITRSLARNKIHEKGQYVFQCDFATFWTIRMLYLVEFADWDSQNVIGHGCGDNSGKVVMGYTDSMPYHTGTTQNLRTSFGYGTQYRNIEGLWDNCFDWCDGIYFLNENIYIIDNPNAFDDAIGGTYIGQRPLTAGFPIKYAVPSNSNYSWALFPQELGDGSPLTYTTDMYYSYSTGTVLYTGSSFNQSNLRGAFYLNTEYKSTSTATNIGCRPQILV